MSRQRITAQSSLQTRIEQAIARGLSDARIMVELGCTHRDIDRAYDRLDAVNREPDARYGDAADFVATTIAAAKAEAAKVYSTPCPEFSKGARSG